MELENDRMTKLVQQVRNSALLSNAIVALLVEKGILTREEIDRIVGQMSAEFDQEMAS